MKRLIPVIVMILCLVPILSPAEPDAAPGALIPAEDENGKWGYVNSEGVFEIPPQYDHAYGFRRDYAQIVVFPEDYEGERNPYFNVCSGIIDRNGAIVLEPAYLIDDGYGDSFYGGWDAGIWYISGGWDGADNTIHAGWFDVRSGFFSGLKWAGVYPSVSDSRLIPVMDDTYRSGYADRTTGELVIPCLYESVDASQFCGGVASVCLVDEEYDAAGNRERSIYHLIDETGKEIPLPEGIFAVPYEGAHDGLVMVADHENAIMYWYDEGILYGYADTQGRLVIEPQFIAVRHFSGGSAAVQFPEGDWGYIDTTGAVTERGLTERPDP